MLINSLLSLIKKNEDFNGLISDKKISESLFTMLNEYLTKADKSEDNIITSEELAELYENNSSEILKAFELLLEELQSENAETPNAQDLTDSFFKMSQELIDGNNFANIDISSLENITKEDFINNTKIEDFHNEHLDKFWGTIAEANPEEIFAKLDENGDGQLSKEELQKFSEIDGDADNISITDLSELIKPETFETTVPELFGSTGEEETETPEVTTEDTPTTQPQDTQPTTPSTPSTPTSGGGDFGGDSHDTGDITPTSPDEGRTIEQINAEIKEQESSKTEIQSKAQTEIEEEEGKISSAVAESDLSDEFKADYENESKRLDEEISQKDTEINEQTGIYQDYTAQADALKGAASDISSQITELQGKMDSIGDDSSLKEKYRTSIENLTNEKEKLEADEKAARDKADETKENIDKLKQDKEDLQKEKDSLLDTLSEKYKDEKDIAEKLKEDIKTYQENIKSIRENLEKNIETADKNIQTLKNEKAQAEQAPKTKEIINANRPVDRTPTALSEDIRNVNWEDYGYDSETGKKFADSARNVESRLNAQGIPTLHNCLGGVKNTFIDVTGSSPFGKPEQGITEAAKCLDTMRNHEGYREITGISADELQYLPAGAVVVWSSSPGGSSAADKYGHISISLGDGNESSSTVRSQYTRVGQSGKPYVFIPIG